jgi:hypothetical protein
VEEVPKLKYAHEISTLAGCPPKGCSERQREQAFRFVHDLDEDSFEPQGIQDPARLIGADDSKCCQLHALSMYTTREKALKKHASNVEHYPNIKKIYGKKLAKGPLDKTDGLQTRPNSVGHISLHQYEQVELHRKFSVVEDLP